MTLTQKILELISNCFDVLIGVLKADWDPSSDNEDRISCRVRQLHSILGNWLVILLGLVLFVPARVHILENLVKTLGGKILTSVIAIGILLCSSWFAALWGKRCNDRAEYKIFLSSLLLTLLLSGVLIGGLTLIGEFENFFRRV